MQVAMDDFTRREMAEAGVWKHDFMFLPLPHEPFRLRRRAWSGAGVTLQEFHADTDCRLLFKQGAGRPVVTFSMSDAPKFFYDGMALAPNHLLVSHHGAASFLRMEAGGGVGEIALCADTIPEAVRHQIEAASATGFAVFAAPEVALARLRASVGYLLNGAEHGALHAAHESAYAAALRSAVIAGFRTARPLPLAAGGARHRAAMERFRHHIDQAGAEPLRLSQLCAATGCGVRTFRMICENCFGFGPIRVMRLRRFVLADRALREGRGNSVTEIALEHGFNELGRFSVGYAALFGRPPSATFRARVSRVA